MEKSRVLVAGLGQAGGNLANTMRMYNARYSNIFINSSLGDSKGLKTATTDNRFTYSGGDGSGSDRTKGNNYIENDKMRLASFLKKFSDFDYLLVFWGMGGGTGSGSVIKFIDMYHKMFPHVIINIVGIIPSLKEDSKKLYNALDCKEELSKVNEYISDVKFICNNKLEDYAEINLAAVKDIDLEYGMTGHYRTGSIDSNNLKNVVSSKGYGVILNMPDNCNSIEDAITIATENSVFAIPDNLDCTYGATNLKIKGYNVDDVSELIECDETIYKTYNNNKYNLIALGGCEMAINEFEDIEIELKEREIRKGKSKRNLGFTATPKKSTTQSSIKVQQDNDFDESDFIDDDDIDALFNPNNFKF